ncbi:acid type B receptor subunit 2 [Seminavis robusta]|uniref:Acid type B receptor subunit 2 n=1 Tax=Seminavis robusta TaxID=568900 RepID=A0A9N8HEU1_9STRA|nr:acid type B receptor subunit 2 [Seminavis robusta]|eukprot:Sro401_g135250.1 acid type B receptor subunit 2 (720) ;mRNA; r:6173-8426
MITRKFFLQLLLMLAMAIPVVPADGSSSSVATGSSTGNTGSIELRTRLVLDIPPYVSSHTSYNDQEQTFEYQGLLPDLLREIQRVALQEDNVTLTFALQPVHYSNSVYSDTLSYLAANCNTTANPMALQDCNQLDLAVGDFWSTSQTYQNVFTPTLLSTGIASLSLHTPSSSKSSSAQLQELQELPNSLLQAQTLKAPICLATSNRIQAAVFTQYPQLHIVQECARPQDCLAHLQNNTCHLLVHDQMALREYEDDFLLTVEDTLPRYDVAWPMNPRLDTTLQANLRKWIYSIRESGFLIHHITPQQHDHYHPQEDLSSSYVYQADEAEEGIPDELRKAANAMVGINFVAVAICGLWVIVHRKRPKVKVAQVPFLLLILLGCFISTSTILAMGRDPDYNNNNDNNNQGNVAGCMAVPWLYSVGFSITFGTLLAKIRRVYLLFKAAASLKRTTISSTSTYITVACIVGVDVAILTIWSIVDPLTQQQPEDDEFMEEEHGYCTSQHWVVFASIIAAYHLVLMGFACYKSYLARHVPAEFSEGNYLSLAVISNMQIFLVGVPVLIIVGLDSQTSYFVKSVIIWMNDFVVLVLVFGNLISRVHCGRRDNKEGELIQTAIKAFQEHEKESAEIASEFYQQSERVLRNMSMNMSLSMPVSPLFHSSCVSEAFTEVDEPISQISQHKVLEEFEDEDEESHGQSKSLEDMFEAGGSSKTCLEADSWHN